jgi:hypothetical protein
MLTPNRVLALGPKIGETITKGVLAGIGPALLVIEPAFDLLFKGLP